MREDSGRVGQLMGDMEGREWKRQLEHLLGLEEQQPHLPPAFQLNSVRVKCGERGE